jgi:hypothetical protein
MKSMPRSEGELRVGFQKLAVVPDLRFQAAGSFWLMSPPRTDPRRILP